MSRYADQLDEMSTICLNFGTRFAGTDAKLLNFFFCWFAGADVDECAEGLAICLGGSQCVNTIGGYECRCPASNPNCTLGNLQRTKKFEIFLMNPHSAFRRMPVV